MTRTNKKFDLEKRTADFGEMGILFCRSIVQDTITKPLISQFIRSATSVGANYMEANGASSKKDFKNKIHICKKEIQESKHWLHMISIASPENSIQARKLWKEAQELTLIFGKNYFNIKKLRFESKFKILNSKLNYENLSHRWSRFYWQSSLSEIIARWS